jgi:arginyl-tRNA synthetase
MRAVADFPGTVASAASELAPHMIAFYLKDLSGIFHTYYNATQILKGDAELIHARLALVRSVKHVIRNGLALIGVDAPERM